MKTLLFLLLFTAPVFAQNPYETAILKEANQMAAGLMNGDPKSVIAYTHPKVVAMMGGLAKMTALVKQNAGAVRFADISFGKPSAVITVGNELQCIVPQRVTMQMAQGSVTGNSSLIAFSFDKGKRWVFVDTNPGVDKIRQVIPNISRKLVIPARQMRAMQ